MDDQHEEIKEIDLEDGMPSEDEDVNKETQAVEPELVSWADFLVNTPPGTEAWIKDLVKKSSESEGVWELLRPGVRLHCTSDICNGHRLFASNSRPQRMYESKRNYLFLDYVCRNCRKTRKVYAVVARCQEKSGLGRVCKIGEWPAFGVCAPARVVELLGSDYELFQKGRCAEVQGLGMGAYSYYCRVIDNQKNRLLDQLIEVSHKLGLDDEKIQRMEEAKSESQFDEVVTRVKDAVPDVVMINGYNPLQLLQAARGEELNYTDDGAYLTGAADIRIVLTALADRIGQALNQKSELQQTIGRLAQKSNGQKSSDDAGDQETEDHTPNEG